MPEQMSLEGVLGDEKRKPPEAAPVAEPAAVATPAPETALGEQKPEGLKKQHQRKEWEAQGRDPETGKFIEKETKPQEPAKAPEKPAQPVEEMTAKEKAAFAKAADETRKRQALEREVADLRAKAAPPAPAVEPPKPFWDDPEGAIKQSEQRVNAAIASTRLQTSEAIARSRYTDFDEKIITFKELAESTPWIVQQMMMQPDPAEFAYRTAKNHKELQDAGGIDAMRSKIEAEAEARIRTKIEAELKDKAEALAKERAALPGSLSDARATGVNKSVWGGPTSLDGVLKG